VSSIVGPLDYYDLPDGTIAPFYVIKFDKRGICVTPKTRASLADTLHDGAITDLYLFSHGWNNSPKEAIATYHRWIEGYRKLMARGPYVVDRDYRPVLAGVVWPSVWIVPWWERGPKIAGGVSVEDERGDAMLRELAEYVPDGDRERFYGLTETPQLSEDEARDFIVMLGSLYGDGDDDVSEVTGPTLDGLLASWDQLARSGGTAEFVPEDDNAAAIVGSGGPAEPEAAGAAARAPADGIRLFSVWQMKDRAATVGANGVADLLCDLLAASAPRPAQPAARTHLIGHSFGAKVLLSAICSPGHLELSRPVDSLLLLQPAVNQYGFADHVPGKEEPGGYHMALERVAQPILSTFSNRDVPLRSFFHLALRRSGDLGEARIAGDEPPSEYAAMGGYGPRGVDSLGIVDILPPGEDYPLGGNAPEIYGVRSHDKIGGHGDVSNDAAYWALYSLVRAS
jgi:hypothetical protein